MTVVYATRGLVEVLLNFAREREPEEVAVSIAVTPAGELDIPELEPEQSVFTHFYLPATGDSVRAVFGVDLGTPPGTHGLFVSHPDGQLSISRTDDLREVVIVAVPPWSHDSVAAFGRDGRRLRLEFLDVEPPRESLAGE